MPSTIRDVAREANVGIGTVSRVLNNSPNVSEETRRRVLAVIDSLDFNPSPMARRFSLGKTHTIGVLAPFFTTPSCVERLRGISAGLFNTGYDFMLFNVETVQRRNEYLQHVPRSKPIDGLLIITLPLTPDEIALLQREKLPTVLIDQCAPGLGYVTVDDEVGGYTATAHLIALGHRRIGFISDYFDDPEHDPFRFTANKQRYTGYRRALEEADLPFRPELHRRGIHAQRDAQALTHALLDLPEPPTAVFAASDTQAIGVLQAARERQLHIPADLSVIGYDDIELSQYLQLTTIRQPLFETGVEATQLLLGLLESQTDSPTQKVLPTELVVRRTTGPPVR